MMFEGRRQQLASPATYRRRVATSASVGLALIVVSLVVGMLGYGGFEKLDAIDAFLNAAMILSGMGPLHNPVTTGGKLFAGLYALFSGFAVLVFAAIIFAPVIHRFLHQFHLDQDEKGGKAK